MHKIKRGAAFVVIVIAALLLGAIGLFEASGTKFRKWQVKHHLRRQRSEKGER